VIKNCSLGSKYNYELINRDKWKNCVKEMRSFESAREISSS
jgi:hypothetical protein